MSTPTDPPPPATSSRFGQAGLSDLAVSPFSHPAAVRGQEVRVAWVGRTSTEDQQDPRQSLVRQLERSKAALPESWAVVGHFYDVESGRMELDKRGRKTDYERFDVPIARDGGISDLLGEAGRSDRRFDVVICESMSRIARKMYETLSVERELERVGVTVFASNEPITLSGGRAQQILQRRINQSVAEYEVLNMLEQSWGGTCTHVREGFNIGKPPYGYTAKRYRHPNPAKAEKGGSKTRLEPDGERASTVVLIAKWRYHEQLGFDTIAERLNTDLEAHPPPQPNGAHRARSAWSKSSVADVLKNPKYTGYQVYNRRARRSRGGTGVMNSPERWVWSPEPAHEPLIPKWMFDEFTARKEAKRGSRDGSDQNRHPNTKHRYALRGRVFCCCGRRMLGHRHRGHGYYRCWPKNNNRGRMERLEGHPGTVYMREDLLLGAVSSVYGRYLFGEHRLNALTAAIEHGDEHEQQERSEQRARLRKRLDEVARKQNNILRQAEDADPADPFTSGLRERYNTLVTEHDRLHQEIAELDEHDATTSRQPTVSELELVEVLPHLSMHLHRAPAELQTRLYELTKLRIDVDYETDQAVIEITLPGEGLEELAGAVEQLQYPDQPAAAPDTAAKSHVKPGVIAAGAPGQIRTDTTRILSPFAIMPLTCDDGAAKLNLSVYWPWPSAATCLRGPTTQCHQDLVDERRSPSLQPATGAGARAYDPAMLQSMSLDALGCRSSLAAR